MNLKSNMDSNRSREGKEARLKIPQKNFAQKWRERFQRRRRKHDPMLALNMSVFNFDDGWNRIFSPLKVRENE